MSLAALVAARSDCTCAVAHLALSAPVVNKVPLILSYNVHSRIRKRRFDYSAGEPREGGETSWTLAPLRFGAARRTLGLCRDRRRAGPGDHDALGTQRARAASADRRTPWPRVARPSRLPPTCAPCGRLQRHPALAGIPKPRSAIARREILCRGASAAGDVPEPRASDAHRPCLRDRSGERPAGRMPPHGACAYRIGSPAARRRLRSSAIGAALSRSCNSAAETREERLTERHPVDAWRLL
jgi:hypothetical protein